jgi:ATP-binding protein involved in chromosome partitioning
MKNVIPVISGKGGVGKSTVAVNLAIALARTGSKVALIDSDFYGPSVPTLMGGGQITIDHEEKIVPPSKYGVKYLSLGFFLPHPDEAVVWRGPMFHKALKQLFQDVNWGEVDYCIVDMPPGTGDAPISLVQMEEISLAGAVVVTTPQEVALADVRKSISMLRKVNVEVLGVVENMAGFVTPDGARYDIFGAGGGQKVAELAGAPLLASIPVDISVREGGDLGVPVAWTGTGPISQQFETLAERLQEILDARAVSRPAVRIVS